MRHQGKNLKKSVNKIKIDYKTYNYISYLVKNGTLPFINGFIFLKSLLQRAYNTEASVNYVTYFISYVTTKIHD
jgi:hypothetical protein